MKKLFILFSFLAVSSLLFISCQSTDSVTSPASDLSKPDPCVFGPNPDAVNLVPGASTDIDLVAGQHDVVGHVTVVQNGDNLEITYYTDGCNIVETHLMVVADPEDFILNSGCNPKVGQFPFGTENVNGTSAGPYIVPIPGGLTGDKVYIGAHAVVECNCEEVVGTGGLCVNTPADGADRYLDENNPPFPTYGTFLIQYTWPGPVTQNFDGFCADPSRPALNGQHITQNFICTYDADFACTGGETVFDMPENIGAVNWLINEWVAGNLPGGTTALDVQVAVWFLLYTQPVDVNGNDIDPTANSGALVTSALGHTGFVPGCDQYVGVISYDAYDYVGGNPLTWCDLASAYSGQPFLIWVPVDCQTNCTSETAWAFNYPIDGTSTEFPGDNWFRYFGYLIESD